MLFVFLQAVIILTSLTALVLVVKYGSSDPAVSRSGRRALQLGLANGLAFLVGLFLALVPVPVLLSWLVFAWLPLGLCHLLWFFWLVCDVRRSTRLYPARGARTDSGGAPQFPG